MNHNEVEGLREILHGLGEADLFSIMDTTTKRMVAAETAQEAIKAILLYTPNAKTLLRRKKIKKALLFNFLGNHGVAVPADGEKYDYIIACLKFWQSTDSYKATDYPDVEDEQECPQVQMLPQPTLDPCKIFDMGIQFSTWFFNGLNSLQDFGPQHFWPDCKLWLNLKVSGFKERELCIMNSDNVATHLSNYVTSEKFFFKPNASSDAVKCHQEQHGLVKIVVSGVVHQQTNCVGLFDASFGLVSDPMLNYNWKVKTVQLLLQLSNGVSGIISSPVNTPYLCQAT